ncbi:MAG TPA: extracellular solute-binding protein [Thermodesulfobacteriota bacterium]
MHGLTRRSLFAGAAAAAGLATIPLGGRSWAQTGRLTVTSYGGTWEKAQREIYAPVFTRATGWAVDVLLGGPPQWLAQIEANRSNPPIHVSLMPVELALAGGKKGLFEKISADKVPNLKDVPKVFVDLVKGWGVCTNYGAAVLGYHRERIKQPPKTYREFVDRTARGEWRAALPGIGWAFTPTILLWPLATVYGGGVKNVTPGFEAVKRMRPNAVFWNSVTEFPQLLETGEADIGIWYDGRIWDAYDAGAKWLAPINPEEGAPMIPASVVKVVNTPDIGWKYVDAMLDPDAQLKFALLINYAVTNSKVVYPPELRERFTPWERTQLPPFEEIGEVIPEWVDRWNREIRA